MSELDKEYTPDASENTEAVEAFEDFEISADGEADSADVPEEIEEAGEADSADVPEEIEEAGEADSADVPEEVEEAEEADSADVAEEVEEIEEAEEADSADVAEEVEEAGEADSADVAEEVEEIEEADSADVPEEIEEAGEADSADVPEEIEEADSADVPEEVEEIEEADSADVPEDVEEIEEADSADVAEEVEEIEEADSADVAEEVEEIEEAEVSDEMFELFGNTDEVEEIGNASAAYAAFNAADDSGESEIDEDDYLDYDDTPRPKKIISGKTALITMLVTGFVTIGIIVTAVWLVFTTQKAMDISVVSFSDNFNACDTKQFSLGQFLGLELVSMSDADCTLSEQDIKDLSRGKTVSKFGDLVGITAKTRFGKIVSMDIEFEKALDKLDQPGAQYIVLLGNIMSGFKNDAHTSDEAFLIAYQLFNTRSRADNMGEDFNVSYLDDIAVYFDYSRISETQLFSDLAIHIENRNPRFVDPEKLDFSWLPFDFSSKDDADDVSASDIEVSQSDR